MNGIDVLFAGIARDFAFFSVIRNPCAPCAVNPAGHSSVAPWQYLHFRARRKRPFTSAANTAPFPFDDGERS
ncbi:hypothetical protein RR42_s1389 [Cupriavidus basilensis]|uniref:Uncharacterized protein n=1 Tax=Cupriavidus basilensis TaxID=68895 RepID=A0A0C4YBL7_9BURK|nr:hypothetical protein RR42_s1389 [Cupriavidus basilensis]